MPINHLIRDQCNLSCDKIVVPYHTYNVMPTMHREHTQKVKTLDPCTTPDPFYKISILKKDGEEKEQPHNI